MDIEYTAEVNMVEIDIYFHQRDDNPKGYRYLTIDLNVENQLSLKKVYYYVLVVYFCYVYGP